jgi:hypothetical protein
MDDVARDDAAEVRRVLSAGSEEVARLEASSREFSASAQCR